MALFILQVPNLPLLLENGSERPTYCLHHARFTEQQNLLSKGKWNVSSYRIVSYHHHIIDFPRKNKHKENSKRTVIRINFKFSQVLTFTFVVEKFSCFQFCNANEHYFRYVEVAKVNTQYSWRLCFTYRRKFSLISVFQLCIHAYGAHNNHFTHSNDWIAAVFILIDKLTPLRPTASFSFFFIRSITLFNSNPHIMLKAIQKVQPIKCLITISVHCSFNPSPNKKINGTKEWMEEKNSQTFSYRDRMNSTKTSTI